MLNHFRSDWRRKSSHYVLKGGFIEKYVMTALQLGTLATAVYRFGAWAARRRAPGRWPLLLVYHMVNSVVRSVTGIGIDARTPIGPGFIIHNFAAIHIEAECIGDNFTVNQGVTVGRDWRNNGRPTIGNNVYLGSGAKVLGNVTLGDNVVVAANALVVASVPDRCTVVGVPARIIAREGASSYLKLKSE